MEWVEGRTVSAGAKVQVYLNWNKEHRFSIVDKSGVKSEFNGLVCGYADSVTLKDCVVKYDLKKQDMTCCGGKKTVHAWVIGTLVSYDEAKPEELQTKVYYNPRVNRKFTAVEQGTVIDSAQMMHFANHVMWV